MRKTLMGASIVGVVCLAMAGLAYGAVQVAFKATVSPSKANKPAGLKTHIAATDPAAQQPPIMNRIVIKLNAGGKYNGSKFPKCKLSALNSKGPKGCPSGSKIGTGTGVGRRLDHIAVHLVGADVELCAAVAVTVVDPAEPALVHGVRTGAAVIDGGTAGPQRLRLGRAAVVAQRQ